MWSYLKLKVVISILSHVSRRKKGRKCAKLNKDVKFSGQDFNVFQHRLSHDACRGVTNAHFSINVVLGKKKCNLFLSPPATVRGVLGNVLDHKLSGQTVLLPMCG